MSNVPAGPLAASAISARSHSWSLRSSGVARRARSAPLGGLRRSRSPARRRPGATVISPDQRPPARSDDEAFLGELPPVAATSASTGSGASRNRRGPPAHPGSTPMPPGKAGGRRYRAEDSIGRSGLDRRVGGRGHIRRSPHGHDRLPDVRRIGPRRCPPGGVPGDVHRGRRRARALRAARVVRDAVDGPLVPESCGRRDDESPAGLRSCSSGRR
jgi:hypothetical protein